MRKLHINNLVICKKCPLTYCLECQPDGCRCGSKEYLLNHGSIVGEGKIEDNEAYIDPISVYPAYRTFQGAAISTTAGAINPGRLVYQGPSDDSLTVSGVSSERHDEPQQEGI